MVTPSSTTSHHSACMMASVGWQWKVGRAEDILEYNRVFYLPCACNLWITDNIAAPRSGDLLSGCPTYACPLWGLCPCYDEDVKCTLGQTIVFCFLLKFHYTYAIVRVPQIKCHEQEQDCLLARVTRNCKDQLLSHGENIHVSEWVGIMLLWTVLHRYTRENLQ